MSLLRLALDGCLVDVAKKELWSCVYIDSDETFSPKREMIFSANGYQSLFHSSMTVFSYGKETKLFCE